MKDVWCLSIICITLRLKVCELNDSNIVKRTYYELRKCSYNIFLGLNISVFYSQMTVLTAIICTSAS